MERLYIENGVPLRVYCDKVFGPAGRRVGRIHGTKAFAPSGCCVGPVVGDRLIYRSAGSVAGRCAYAPVAAPAGWEPRCGDTEKVLGVLGVHDGE